jgi:hypothetical protein
MDKTGVIKPGLTPDPNAGKKSTQDKKSAEELDNGIMRDISDRVEQRQHRTNVPREYPPGN